MDPGSLRHRLEIQRATETRSTDGGVVETWPTIGERRAALEFLEGREYERAAQVHAEVTHKVTMRYVDGLTTKDRLHQSSTARTFAILRVANPDEMRLWTEVLAKVTVAA